MFPLLSITSWLLQTIKASSATKWADHCPFHANMRRVMIELVRYVLGRDKSLTEVRLEATRGKGIISDIYNTT